MPLRTAKPYFRIDRLRDRYVVSYFTSKSQKLLRRGWVELPLNDPGAFKGLLAVYVEDTIQSARKQGK